jgi:hypothetical protein
MVVTLMKKNLIFFTLFFIQTSSPLVASPVFNNETPLHYLQVIRFNDDLKNYEAAETFLLSIEHEKDFNIEVAKEFILSIVPICENDNLDLKFRQTTAKRNSKRKSSFSLYKNGDTTRS